DVVAKPSRERDVPSLPEIPEAGREIRVVEIFWKAEAEDVGQAAGDGRVALEIAENLQAKSSDDTPGGEHSRAFSEPRPVSIHERAEVVAQRAFQKVASRNPVEALGKRFPSQRP